MSEAWLHFAVVIFVQFLVFIAAAHYAKRLSDVPRVLGRGVVIGLIIGIAVDLILGKFLGVYSYVLGFGALFLIPNALFSYGLFAATILLFERARLSRLYILTVVMMAVYEVANHFFRVWTWEFTSPLIPFPIALSMLYLAGAVVVIGI